MHPVSIAVAVLIALGTAARWRRSSWARRAVGVVLVAGFGVYGSGVIVLPSVAEVVSTVGRTLGPYTYVLVGVLAFLETGAFVGLIAPGETAILVGGAIAGQGPISLPVLIFVVWASALGGDVTSYLLGRRLGREFLLRHGPRVKITHERLEQVERFFDDHGRSAVFLGRFVGLVRAVMPFVAGASKFPLRAYLPIDVVGCGIWGTAYVLIGYVFSSNLDRASSLASTGGFAIAAVIVVLVGGIAAYRFLRVADNRERARRLVDEQARRPGIGATIRGARRVARPVGALARRMVGPPAAHARRISRPMVALARRIGRPAGGVARRVAALARRLAERDAAALAAIGTFGAAGFGLLAGALADRRFVAGDRGALRLADDLRDHTGIDVARVFTDLGSTPVIAALVVAAAIVLGRRRRVAAATVVIVATVLTIAGDQLAKAAEGRPRPAHHLVYAAGLSFPSGHAAHSVTWVAVAIALVGLLPSGRRRAWGGAALVALAVVLAVAIGLSRVYLHVHYLSDVLGGWGLGAAIFSAAALIALLVGRVGHNVRDG